MVLNLESGQQSSPSLWSSKNYFWNYKIYNQSISYLCKHSANTDIHTRREDHDEHTISGIIIIGPGLWLDLLHPDHVHLALLTTEGVDVRNCTFQDIKICQNSVWCDHLKMPTLFSCPSSITFNKDDLSCLSNQFSTLACILSLAEQWQCPGNSLLKCHPTDHHHHNHPIWHYSTWRESYLFLMTNIRLDQLTSRHQQWLCRVGGVREFWEIFADVVVKIIWLVGGVSGVESSAEVGAGVESETDWDSWHDSVIISELSQHYVIIIIMNNSSSSYKLFHCKIILHQ